ncbi:MAG: sulfotransferase [Rhodobacteraceae bacterium]|nr:sulfotransferase [Paracoccaceae bacterium]
MYTKPNFIGIGQAKAATSWLYYNLRHHREVWVPPQKELHFFNKNFDYAACERRLIRFLGTPATEPGVTPIPIINVWDKMLPPGLTAEEQQAQMARLQMDFDFFIKALLSPRAKRVRQKLNKELNSFPKGEAFILRKRWHLNWYSELFPDTGMCCGEVTPHYSVLDAKNVGIIARFFPQLRVILILRDPVQRALSHIQLNVRRGSWKGPFTADTLIDLCRKHTVVLTKSRVSRLKATWFKHVPKDRLLVLDFRDIVAPSTAPRGPVHVLGDVAAFLGLDPDGFTADPYVHVMGNQSKIEIPDAVTDWLQQELAGEADHLDDILARHKP